jgi:hypothetical protein
VRAVSGGQGDDLCDGRSRWRAGHRVAGSHVVVVFKPEVVATLIEEAVFMARSNSPLWGLCVVL